MSFRPQSREKKGMVKAREAETEAETNKVVAKVKSTENRATAPARGAKKQKKGLVPRER